jgi:hydrogenase nickel incorporation protein HypB
VLIENVGNLVCPCRVRSRRGAQGRDPVGHRRHDKPIKYPDLFHAADLMLVNKVDLLPYVDFDVDAAIGWAASRAARHLG